MSKFLTLLGAHARRTIKAFAGWWLVLCALFLLLRSAEMLYDRWLHGALLLRGSVWWYGVVKDLCFLLTLGGWIYLCYFILSAINRRWSNGGLIVAGILLCLIQVALSQYFLTTLVPLGADLWSYSWKDISQTVKAAGISAGIIIVLLLVTVLLGYALIVLPRRVRMCMPLCVLLLLLCVGSQWMTIAATVSSWRNGSTEYGNSLSTCKSYFFYKQSLVHFFPEPVDTDIYADSYIGDYGGDNAAALLAAFRYTNAMMYPFMHADETPDVLSPFIRMATPRPNIVILLVEGLGRAFTNEGAYLGNFTPFLDSLSGHSLYWENFLSEGGRTFAVLPSLLGSLPFARNGFAELGNNMPAHLSLLSLLKHNGYRTAFYYGGNAQFDNMALFLQKNAIDNIYDIASFPVGYTQLPANAQGFSWGYGDKELFRHYFTTLTDDTPYCKVLLTVSTHSPFLINQQEDYLRRFEQRMDELGFDANGKAAARNYKMQFASVLFADDALKQFFNSYAQRPDFQHTIFLITGDHRMPEIPMTDKLDRYHVPLIVFSPLLTRTAKFSSISTHFDIAPSLLQVLAHQYHLRIPSEASWLGSGLDTTRAFGNRHAYALMQTKNDIIDFIEGTYMINGNDLYSINNKMQLEPLADEEKRSQLQGAFEAFKQKNNQFLAGSKLVPDSVYRQYYPK